MKKCMLLFMVLVAMSATLRAQGVGAGLLAAGVASQIDGDSYAGYKKAGYSFGGFAWYDFNDRISLMPEITFSNRGSREVVNGYGQYNLSLIDVPVLVRYRLLGKIGDKSLLFEAGPSANILLRAKGGFGNNRIDLMHNFHRVGVSATLGPTIFVNPHIALFGRWTYALTYMNKDARIYRQYMRCHFITFGLKVAFK
jgi:Outer membrane protein beta-barrel domain